jgi:hypothetical protein
LSNRGLKINLLILSDDPNTEPTIRKIFDTDNVHLKVINKASITAMIEAAGNLTLLFNPALEEAYYNIIVVIVDNKQMLSMPPFSGNAIYSRNKSRIANLSAGFEIMFNFLKESNLKL